MDRRTFLQASAALGLAASAPSAFAMRGARVVVIGGGYGGATAAKYIRMLSNNQIDVTLVEPNKEFISCPMSNLVIGGSRKLADILDGTPVLLGRDGKIFKDVLKRCRLAESEVESALREADCKLEDMKYLFLEADGSITIQTKN